MSETDEYATDAEVSDTKAEYTEEACSTVMKAFDYPAHAPGEVVEFVQLDPDVQNAVRVAMVGILDGWEALIREDFRASQPPAERVLGFQPPR